MNAGQRRQTIDALLDDYPRALAMSDRILGMFGDGMDTKGISEVLVIPESCVARIIANRPIHK